MLLIAVGDKREILHGLFFSTFMGDRVKDGPPWMRAVRKLFSLAFEELLMM